MVHNRKKLVNLFFMIILLGFFSLTGFTGCTKKKKSSTEVSDSIAQLEPVTISEPISTLNLNTANYTSASKVITVTGTCRTGAVVTTSEDASLTANCEEDFFSINIEVPNDGAFNYSFTQSTSSANASAPITLQLMVDTASPSALSLTSPNSNPLNSKESSVALAGTCETGATILISGDLSSSTNCENNLFSFNLSKLEDASYSYSLYQRDSAGNSSPSLNFVWNRDATAPLVPEISSPPSSPYYSSSSGFNLVGTCETGTTVNLSGASVSSATCSGGLYSFSINTSNNTDYNFSISQTDLTGNQSPSVSFQRIYQPSAVSTPEITSPSAAMHYSNSSTLTIVGTCTSGYTVSLSGAATATTTCSGANSFSFENITKSTDDSYSFDIKQSYSGVYSNTASVVWVRDTVLPTIEITSPSVTTISGQYHNILSSEATFNFTASDGSGSGVPSSNYECNLDDPNTPSSWTSCSSPVTQANLANGSHVFYVRAADMAGNIGTQSFTWTQSYYKTIALYHLDSSSPTTDSGNYSTLFSNTLTATNVMTTNSGGAINQCSSFGSNSYYSVTSNNSLNFPSTALTVEGFVRFSSLTSNSGKYYTLVSKSNASPNLGWELRLRKTGSSSGRFLLDFVVSSNGSSSTPYTTSSYFTVSIDTWYYFAVTYSPEIIRLYFSSSSSGSISPLIYFTAPAPLANLNSNSSAPLRIGANATSGSGSSLSFPNGSGNRVDEIRISRVVRDASGQITIPTSSNPFIAD